MVMRVFGVCASAVSFTAVDGVNYAPNRLT